MKKLSFILLLSLFSIISCKKDAPPTKEDLYPENPVSTPSSTAISVFHKPDPFYQMWVYRFDTQTNKWTNRIGSHFSTISTTDNSYVGFTNPYVSESGTSMFDMVRLYTNTTGSTNIKTVRINADQVLQFFPDFINAPTGIVKVKTQDVVLTKTGGVETFKIGISGQGTYDERTKVINLEVVFNETAIGGQSAVKRKYILSSIEQTLN